MTISAADLPRYHRRNWLAFFADYVLFGLGLTFASTTTTLPAFVAELTDNKVLIGAVSAVWTGSWLLPQIFAANYVSNKPRKLPLALKGSWIGRPALLLFVFYLALGGVQFRGLTIFLFLAAIAFFIGIDALVALAWFDLLGKSMAPAERSRIFGFGQVATGVLAIGAGILIAYLLGASGPAFPFNYAIIFALAGACFMGSLWALSYLVEPRETVPDERVSLRHYLPQLVSILRTDQNFARLNLSHLLIGAASLAMPFYAVYAIRVVGVSEARIGLFAMAQTIGSALAGLLLGPLAERRGSHRAIQTLGFVHTTAPMLALVLARLPTGALLDWLYPLIFVLLGMGEGAAILGYYNYVLDIAPTGQRPDYIGLTNTLAGPLLVVPLLGGWILERSSYSTVFGLAAVVVFCGALISLTLKSPRPEHKSI